jgi:hypothetical protein
MCQQGSVEPHSMMLRSWQLAILRFAVTLDSADVMLRQYLARINDFPLKRALAAALEIEPASPTSVTRRSKPATDLWRGLSSRDIRP